MFHIFQNDHDILIHHKTLIALAVIIPLVDHMFNISSTHAGHRFVQYFYSQDIHNIARRAAAVQSLNQSKGHYV